MSIDAGARRAVVELGKSLLPVGVTAVSGEFRKGDVISVCDAAGAEVARGLTNYAAADAQRLKGRPRDAAQPYAELIHRDNLVVTGVDRGTEGPRDGGTEGRVSPPVI